jgi:hypothetical protein
MSDAIELTVGTLVKEYALDGSAFRFVFVIFAPALICIASFACNCIVGSVFQTLGPIRQVTQNSKYYSGIAPKRTMGELAHVTVQLPVYKESLEDVIIPTIISLKKAITTYERQGGSSYVMMVSSCFPKPRQTNEGNSTLTTTWRTWLDQVMVKMALSVKVGSRKPEI